MREQLPGNVFQIMIVDRPVEQVAAKPLLDANAASLKALYPEARYHLYDGNELADFIATHFPPEVAAAYHALIPFAFKADLARYCLLHKLGGLYSDLSYLHIHRMAIKPATEMVMFRDIPGHPSWAASNGVLYARAGSPVMERAIARVLEHHRAGFRGIHPLEVTGPYMLGRVLAETDRWSGIVFGDSRLISTDKTRRANIAKIMPSGEVVAIRTKTRDGAITDMVAKGGNRYVKLWEKGQVWKGSKRRSLWNVLTRRGHPDDP